MLGLVLVTHAPLGQAILACIGHIMGERPEGLEVVDIEADMPVEGSIERIKYAARAVDKGVGVVFLTDLFGATPSNAAVRAAAEERDIASVLLSGCNLPMIIRSLSFRDLPLDQIAEKLICGGRNGIICSGAAAPQTQPFKPPEQNGSTGNQHQQ